MADDAGSAAAASALEATSGVEVAAAAPHDAKAASRPRPPLIHHPPIHPPPPVPARPPQPSSCRRQSPPHRRSGASKPPLDLGLGAKGPVAFTYPVAVSGSAAAKTPLAPCSTVAKAPPASNDFTNVPRISVRPKMETVLGRGLYERSKSADLKPAASKPEAYKSVVSSSSSSMRTGLSTAISKPAVTAVPTTRAPATPASKLNLPIHASAGRIGLSSKTPLSKKPCANSNITSKLTTSPSHGCPDAVPLIDPKVVPAVHSIISLLQIYGPLSYEQLKWNMVPQLVPVHSPNPSVINLPPLKAGEAPPPLAKQIFQRRKRDKLQKVLDILQELGVIHLVDKKKIKPPVFSSGSGKLGKLKLAATTTAAGRKTKLSEPDEDPNPVYCFGNGSPRMDTVLPSQVLDEIRLAGEEVIRTKRRIEILRSALIVHIEGSDKASEGSGKEVSTGVESAGSSSQQGKREDGRRRNKQDATPYQCAHATLKKIYSLHPEEISRDPVYAAALRMFRVLPETESMAMLDRHEMPMENTPEMESVIEVGLGFRTSEGNGSRGKLGSSKKRASGSSLIPAGEEGGSAKKKRKKGRPPKNANSSSADKMKDIDTGTAVGDSARATANDTWI